MDEQLLSWILAFLVLSILTLFLTMYQVFGSPIIQPIFLFFAFQLPSIISLVIILYYVIVKRYVKIQYKSCQTRDNDPDKYL